MMRIAGIAVLLCQVSAAGAPAAARPDISGQELLKRAKAVRAQAESDLARARLNRLEKRKALTGKLQQAYADLEAAKTKALAAGKALEHLRAEARDADERRAGLARRIENTIANAAALARVTVKPSDTTEALERTVWEGFRLRLAGIDRDAEIRRADETIVDRQGNETTVPVVHLGGYGAYACGRSREGCGLLRVLGDGRQVVTGPYLDEAQAGALWAAASGPIAHLPIDVDGAMGERAVAEPAGIRTWLEAGGLFIIPIVIVGALGVILILERVAYLAISKAPPSLTPRVLRLLERRDTAAARELLAESRKPQARVLLAGIETIGEPPDRREAAMESALLAEAPRLERSLSLLGALAGVAPLLGLLGTVSGMIATFDTISTAGTGNPRLLSGGISEALITTQLGLMVAIPLLLAHAWLRRWVERREAALEYSAIQIAGAGKAPEGGDE